MSVDVGVPPVLERHAGVVVAVVQAVADPHLQVLLLQRLLVVVDPHSAEVPHLQVPAEQLSLVSDEHGEATHGSVKCKKKWSTTIDI